MGQRVQCSIATFVSFVALPFMVLLGGPLAATEYFVGPGQTYATIGSVPALQPGDIVSISAGTYHEVVRWSNPGTAANPILIRGIGSTRPVVDATGLTVDGVLPRPRAVFQIEASYITIQNLEFVNARNGDNGSGIRVTTYGSQTTNVVIDNCKVDNNDMGIMSDHTDNLLIQYCEVANNGTSNYSGYSHNFYLGGQKATVQYCFIHDSPYGQNFKTRGHYTELLYNFIYHSQDGEVGLVDEVETAAANSNAVMIGNLIVAKPRIAGFNSARFIQFGQDSGGAHNGVLYCVNNTFVAGDSRINFLDSNIAGASIVATNNIFFNSSTISTGNGPVSGTNNWAPAGASIPSGMAGTVFGSDPGFANAASNDFHLTAASPCRDIGANAPAYLDGNGVSHSAVPSMEYVLQLQSAARSSDGKLDAGAYEFNSGPVAPSISSQPADQRVNVGQTATFTVTAAGTAPLAYVWKKNGAVLAAPSLPSYTTPATTAADNGALFTVTVSNGSGSVTSNAAKLTVNIAPVLSSGPAATPNPATTGQAVNFSAAATDVNGDTMTYAWSFGDGANGSGPSTSHIYSTAGTYTASVKVSDPGGLSTTGSVQVTVNASSTGGGGGGNGSGGSGGSGTGGGGGGGGGGSGGGHVKKSMTVTRVQGSAKFSVTGRDTASVTGVLPAFPALYDPTGKMLTLNIDNAPATFTLDASGRGKNPATGSVSLKFRPAKRNKTTHKLEFQGGVVAFSGRLIRGTFAGLWGLDPNTASRNVSISVPVSIDFDGVTYEATLNATYTAKAHVGGSFKLVK